MHQEESPQKKRPLKMKFAGGLVKHLGSQLYAGVVPALTELIANAWDADATLVEIRVPLETKIHPFVDKIIVKDNGYGMTFEECQEAFLILGRDKRTKEGKQSRNGRLLMGRKGLGKLACFGIAKNIEIKTVTKTGELTNFSMDYEEMQKRGDFHDYEVNVIEDGIQTKEKHGTDVVLSGLTLEHQIDKDEFFKSIATKFLLPIISSEFKIIINGEELKRIESDLDFTFPNEDDKKAGIKIENGYAIEKISNVGEIRWKIGFTEVPIKIEDARGICVIAHNKQIQRPWLFKIGKGFKGQLGQQYVTGEIVADFLDDNEDLVTTDRAGVLWEKSPAKELMEWAQKKITDIMDRWNDERVEKRFREIAQSELYTERIAKFQKTEKEEIENAIKTVTGAVDNKKKMGVMVEVVMSAYEDRNFLDLIRRINTLSPDVQCEILPVIEEFKVLEAIKVAFLVRGRLEVITKFKDMIESKIKELEMQKLLEASPWLIALDMDNVEPKPTMKEILIKHFHIKVDAEGSNKIPDFFCLGDAKRTFVVEIKRPEIGVNKDDLNQIEQYVDYLRTEERKNSNEHDRKIVNGFLIGSWLVDGLEEKMDRLDKSGIHFRTWKKLLEIAEYNHRDYFRVVKERAPKDDPRIQNLEKMDIDIKTEKKKSDLRDLMGNVRIEENES